MDSPMERDTLLDIMVDEICDQLWEFWDAECIQPVIHQPYTASWSEAPIVVWVIGRILSLWQLWLAMLSVISTIRNAMFDDGDPIHHLQNLLTAAQEQIESVGPPWLTDEFWTLSTSTMLWLSMIASIILNLAFLAGWCSSSRHQLVLLIASHTWRAIRATYGFLVGDPTSNPFGSPTASIPAHSPSANIERKGYVKISPKARRYAEAEVDVKEEELRHLGEDSWFCSKKARDCQALEEECALLRDCEWEHDPGMRNEIVKLLLDANRQGQSSARKSTVQVDQYDSPVVLPKHLESMSGSDVSSRRLNEESQEGSPPPSPPLQQRANRRVRARAERETLECIQKSAVKIELQAKNRILRQQVSELLEEASSLTGQSYAPVLDRVLADQTPSAANFILKTALRDSERELNRLRKEVEAKAKARALTARLKKEKKELLQQIGEYLEEISKLAGRDHHLDNFLAAGLATATSPEYENSLLSLALMECRKEHARMQSQAESQKDARSQEESATHNESEPPTEDETQTPNINQGVSVQDEAAAPDSPHGQENENADHPAKGQDLVLHRRATLRLEVAKDDLATASQAIKAAHGTIREQSLTKGQDKKMSPGCKSHEKPEAHVKEVVGQPNMALEYKGRKPSDARIMAKLREAMEITKRNQQQQQQDSSKAQARTLGDDLDAKPSDRFDPERFAASGRQAHARS